MALTLPREVFTQHDAQELSRIFIDTLETKMKGTKLDGKLIQRSGGSNFSGLIEKMYRGTELSVIECLNVKQSSTMKQTFYGMLLDEEKNLTYKDLSLNVKGCPSTLHSLRKYCEEEMLTGADQYDAGETHGKQVCGTTTSSNYIRTQRSTSNSVSSLPSFNCI